MHTTRIESADCIQIDAATGLVLDCRVILKLSLDPSSEKSKGCKSWCCRLQHEVNTHCQRLQRSKLTLPKSYGNDSSPAKSRMSHCQRCHGHPCHPSADASRGAHAGPLQRPQAPHSHSQAQPLTARGALSRAGGFDSTMRPKRLALNALWTSRCLSAFDCRSNGDEYSAQINLEFPTCTRDPFSHAARSGMQTCAAAVRGVNSSSSGLCHRRAGPCR